MDEGGACSAGRDPRRERNGARALRVDRNAVSRTVRGRALRRSGGRGRRRERQGQRLAEFLDILPENIVCIGDGWNDIPMLRAAGRAFAPETALPEVLALPDVTKLGAPGRCIRDVIDRLEADQK